MDQHLERDGSSAWLEKDPGEDGGGRKVDEVGGADVEEDELDGHGVQGSAEDGVSSRA